MKSDIYRRSSVACTVWAFLCLQATALFSADSPMTNSEVCSQAESATNRILIAANFEELVEAESWLTENASEEVVREVIIRLLEGVMSQKETPLVADWNSPGAFAFACWPEDSDVPASTFVPQTGRRFLPAYRRTAQDVTIAGGRCAWTIERLLGLRLLPVVKDMDADVLAATHKEIVRDVLRGTISVPEIARCQQLDENGRARVAASKATNSLILAELANDESQLVRRAVATNLNTPFDVILKMRDTDPDDQVKELADKNSRHARLGTTQAEIEYSHRLKLFREKFAKQ